VHLALAGAGAMTVSWVTPSPSARPTVWYRPADADEPGDAAAPSGRGAAPEQPLKRRATATAWLGGGGAEAAWATANATTASYTCTKSICPASYASGSIHHATLEPLLPDTRYVYRCAAGRALALATVAAVYLSVSQRRRVER
jgi:hypothetical protein